MVDTIGHIKLKIKRLSPTGAFLTLKGGQKMNEELKKLIELQNVSAECFINVINSEQVEKSPELLLAISEFLKVCYSNY